MPGGRAMQMVMQNECDKAVRPYTAHTCIWSLVHTLVCRCAPVLQNTKAHAVRMLCCCHVNVSAGDTDHALRSTDHATGRIQKL